ncbi:hypothetical protein [Flavobacterium sp.]|uniref:hypothetical protein n=1 Tax=Flavobacterium sp. TaxID=239 RepID=UPI0011FBC85B|nr:hypothetical protein [Flavobacterium sp.]RZJ69534.1 MAG: hypothetical protein EOO49_17075 [Flavobacterium sp.]
MKTNTILTIIVLFLVASNSNAQTKEKIYDSEKVQVAPQFPGGEYKFIDALQAAFEAKKKNAPSIIDAWLVIEKNGSVSKVVASGDNGAFSKSDNAFLAKIAPKWKPAKVDGKAVRCRTFASLLVVKEIVSGQGSAKEEIDTDTSVYFARELEKNTEFPGGISQFENYLAAQANIPDKANFTGSMRVMCIVEKDGAITNIKTSGNLGMPMSQEITRVLAESPKWTAGKRNGKIVRSHFICVISFSEGKTRIEIQKS